MGDLSLADHRRLSGFLGKLYAQHDPGRLPGFLVREVQLLVGGHQVTWNNLDLQAPSARMEAYPELPDRAWADATFERHMLAHPCLRHWLRTGSSDPVAISDFLSAREYRRSALYAEFFRHLGYEDQLTVALTPPRERVLGLGFGRSRRGVSRRDRAMLRQLMPHVLQAWENTEAVARTARVLELYRRAAGDLGVCVVTVAASGHVLDLPAPAGRWVRAHFPRDSGSTVLPNSLRRWISHCMAKPGQNRLVSRNAGRQLVVRCFPQPDGAAMLVMSESAAPAGTRVLRARGITRRELEVLMAARGGGTNLELGAALGISAATVKKHLENIYAKLGVSSRTSAVSLLAGNEPAYPADENARLTPQGREAGD